MNTAEFEARLRQDGYLEVETMMLEPRPANGDHGHHFSVRGLVVAGAFTVSVDGSPRSYRPGDVFEVAEGVIHSEAIGPEGARVVIGRKY